MPRVLLVILAIALALGAAFLNFGGRGPNPDLTAFGSLLGTLLFTSAILERALDVWLTMVKGATADQLDAQIRALKAQLASTPPDPAPLEAELKTVTEQRTTHQAETRKLAAPAALVAGSMISAVGLRSLQPLFEKADASWATSHQGHIFTAVDVLLTGTLLAGGSDGIHWIVALYRDWMDRNRTKA